jgi:hypothetical protein
MEPKKWKVVGKRVAILGLIGLGVCLDQEGAAVAPGQAKATPAKAAAEKYTVLNPRADRPPIDAKALAPRLTSLAGKTVYVNGSDFDLKPGLEIMLEVARGLAKAAPGIKVAYISDRYGNVTVDSVDPTIRIARDRVDTEHRETFKEAEKQADAVVTGLGF